MDPSERNPGFTANRHDYEMLDIIGQLTVLSCSIRKLLRLSIGFKAPYFLFDNFCLSPYIRELSKGATAVVQMANFTNPSSGEKYKCAIKRIYCERIKNNLDMARVSSNCIFFLRKDAGSKTTKSFFFSFSMIKRSLFFSSRQGATA